MMKCEKALPNPAIQSTEATISTVTWPDVRDPTRGSDKPQKYFSVDEPGAIKTSHRLTPTLFKNSKQQEKDSREDTKDWISVDDLAVNRSKLQNDRSGGFSFPLDNISYTKYTDDTSGIFSFEGDSEFATDCASEQSGYKHDAAFGVHIIDTDSDDDWRSTHPDHWTCAQVLAWIYDTANQEPDVDVDQVIGEAFSGVSGIQLRTMTHQDFTSRDKQHGHIFYEELRKLTEPVEFVPPEECDLSDKIPLAVTALDNLTKEQPMTVEDLLRYNPTVKDQLPNSILHRMKEDLIVNHIPKNTYQKQLKEAASITPKSTVTSTENTPDLKAHSENRYQNRSPKSTSTTCKSTSPFPSTQYSMRHTRKYSLPTPPPAEWHGPTVPKNPPADTEMGKIKRSMISSEAPPRETFKLPAISNLVHKNRNKSDLQTIDARTLDFEREHELKTAHSQAEHTDQVDSGWIPAGLMNTENATYEPEQSSRKQGLESPAAHNDTVQDVPFDINQTELADFCKYLLHSDDRSPMGLSEENDSQKTLINEGVPVPVLNASSGSGAWSTDSSDSSMDGPKTEHKNSNITTLLKCVKQGKTNGLPYVPRIPDAHTNYGQSNFNYLTGHWCTVPRKSDVDVSITDNEPTRLDTSSRHFSPLDLSREHISSCTLDHKVTSRPSESKMVAVVSPRVVDTPADTNYFPVRMKRSYDTASIISTGSTETINTSYSGSDADPPPPAKKKSNRGRKPGQLSKGNHLWEFLLELLRDERHSPSIIKWENRPKGIFRIVKSREVATLWGQRKNRPTMNYEKLSRALRFCKTVGYIKDVPKDGPYPKKLCFSFGDKTSGWEEPVNMPYNQFNQNTTNQVPRA